MLLNSNKKKYLQGFLSKLIILDNWKPGTEKGFLRLTLFERITESMRSRMENFISKLLKGIFESKWSLCGHSLVDLVENTWSIFGYRKRRRKKKRGGGMRKKKSHPQMSLKKKEASGRNCSCSGKKKSVKNVLKLWAGCDGKTGGGG